MKTNSKILLILILFLSHVVIATAGYVFADSFETTGLIFNIDGVTFNCEGVVIYDPFGMDGPGPPKTFYCKTGL